MSLLPAFLRRRLLLSRARRLFAAGDTRAALDVLADPWIANDPTAQRLVRAAEAAQAPATAAGTGTQAAIQDLLARLRSERAARGPDAQAANTMAGTPAEFAPSAKANDNTPRHSRARILFRLAVDDAGEFLVAVGDGFTFGHLISTQAELRFLAHIEREHARLVYQNDFHAGPTWRLIPIDGAAARVCERAVPATGLVVADGDRVVLGQNLAFRFRAGELASASAVLDLENGLECLGAGRVILMAPGPDGRLRIGSSSARPIRVPALAHDVTLEIVAAHASADEVRLALGCAGGIEQGVRPGHASPTARTLIVPPRASERFTCGSRPPSQAPFEIVISRLSDDLIEGAPQH